VTGIEISAGALAGLAFGVLGKIGFTAAERAVIDFVRP